MVMSQMFCAYIDCERASEHAPEVFFFIIIIIAIRSRTVFAAATTHFHVNSKNFVGVSSRSCCRTACDGLHKTMRAVCILF